MPTARDLVGILWESAEQKLKRNKTEGQHWRLGWERKGKTQRNKGEGAVRKKRWEAEGESCQGSDQQHFSEHGVSPLLHHFCWLETGSFSVFLIPSEEVPSVLVLPNQSGTCLKYSSLSWASFPSTCNSFHCFLPEGVLVLFKKTLDTLLSIGYYSLTQIGLYVNTDWKLSIREKNQSARSEKLWK